jgi:hypothetical protein
VAQGNSVRWRSHFGYRGRKRPTGGSCPWRRTSVERDTGGVVEGGVEATGKAVGEHRGGGGQLTVAAVGPGNSRRGPAMVRLLVDSVAARSSPQCRCFDDTTEPAQVGRGGGTHGATTRVLNVRWLDGGNTQRRWSRRCGTGERHRAAKRAGAGDGGKDLLLALRG